MFTTQKMETSAVRQMEKVARYPQILSDITQNDLIYERMKI